MKTPSSFVVIFTDLDGTLLDHNSYSAAPADQMIKYMDENALAAVIPITSKTFAELQKPHSLPFENSICVTENGSVIHMPPEKHEMRPIMLGIEYKEILEQIASLPENLKNCLRGFHQMSPLQVAQATGLAIKDAELAKKREATEPFLWSGSAEDMAALKAIFAGTDIQIQQGGRFYHLTGNATKQQAMARVVNMIGRQYAEKEIITIALGDGPNDLAMIEAADYGVIMPNPHGVTIHSDKNNIRIAPFPGPKGWVAAVTEILLKLGLIPPEN